MQDADARAGRKEACGLGRAQGVLLGAEVGDERDVEVGLGGERVSFRARAPDRIRAD